MATATLLADRVEIADLVTRLNHWLDDTRISWQDDARYTALDRIYTDDVVLRSPRGSLQGIDEMIEYLRRHTADAERSQHVASDVLIEVDGDQAEVTANGVVHSYRPDESPFRTSGLRSAFTAVRTPDGWRLNGVEMTLLWSRES